MYGIYTHTYTTHTSPCPPGWLVPCIMDVLHACMHSTPCMMYLPAQLHAWTALIVIASHMCSNRLLHRPNQCVWLVDKNNVDAVYQLTSRGTSHASRLFLSTNLTHWFGICSSLFEHMWLAITIRAVHACNCAGKYIVCYWYSRRNKTERSLIMCLSG